MLALIFVIVLIVQFGTAGTSSKPVEATALAPPHIPRPAGAANDPADGGRRSPHEPSRAWPEFALATVLKHDPFAPGAAFAALQKAPQSADSATDVAARKAKESLQKAVQSADKLLDVATRRAEEARQKRADKERRLAQVHQESVRLIMGTDKKGFVAVVGDKTLRVGDRLHGFRVKEINADGVVLEDSQP